MSLFTLIIKCLCSVHSFCCCPSGLLFISNHHSLFPPLSWQEDAFFLPCLFSSVALTCFLLSSIVLLRVVRKTFTQGMLGLATVPLLGFPQGSPGPPGQIQLAFPMLLSGASVLGSQDLHQSKRCSGFKKSLFFAVQPGCS